MLPKQTFYFISVSEILKNVHKIFYIFGLWQKNEKEVFLMSYQTEEIRRLLTETNDRIDHVRKIVKHTPIGRIAQIKEHGKPFLILERRNSAGRHRYNIKSDDNRIIPILRGSFFRKELDVLLRNKYVLEQTLSRIREFDYSREYMKLMNKLDMLDGVTIDKLLSSEEASEWENEPYEQLNYMPERKVHPTSRGLKVRSKGEVIIAERMYQHNIPFRYEQVIRPDESSMWAPDFTIRRQDGKIFYWEHLGMMSVKDYADKQRRKMLAYGQMNIVPWDNLIVTYENANGSVDQKIVESEILNKLIL